MIKTSFYGILAIFVLITLIFAFTVLAWPYIKLYILKRKLKKQGPSKAREYAKENLRNIKKIANNPTTLLAQKLLKQLDIEY